MGGIMSKPKAPPITPPTPMPDTDDEAIKAAKKKQAAANQNRAGRNSTILTDNSETLG